MFTIEEISSAHAKVKSGADFPAYIADLKKLGVKFYDTFVADGHSDFYGNDSYKVSSNAKYQTLSVFEKSNTESFTERLKAHQQGQTDYLTFCNDSAQNGVEKWTVDLTAMTCNYYDKSGNLILSENIPG